MAQGRGRTPGSRSLHERVKTARGRSVSSTRWLQRQLNDPYVQEAKRRGYRSRAAFKLIQIDERFKLLRAGLRVVDLGAAPGGWTQVLVERHDGSRGSEIMAVDILEMEPVGSASLLTLDFLEEDAPMHIRQALAGPADLVLSDLAAPAVGHRATDHLRTLVLAEAAAEFAVEVLAPGGACVVKVLEGVDEPALFKKLMAAFDQVQRFKPAASRSESTELYLVARGFRGG